MNLHPYLTPDLQALIRTAKPEEIEQRLSHLYGVDPDTERRRLGFRVEAKTSGGCYVISRGPRSIEGFLFSGGYQGLKRRVNLKANGDWRELFIQRFNEVLHDCERICAAERHRAKANMERENAVKTRSASVLRLIGDLPPHISWQCENRNASVTERLTVDTSNLSPDQIDKTIDLIRSFQP